MTAVSAPAPAAHTLPPQASLGRDVLVLTWRNLKKVSRVPQLLFFSLIQPIVFLTLFSQVFRSIANTPGFPAGVEYIDYLVPAILVTTVATNGIQAGIGMAGDLATGMLDRFRSMPITRSGVLVARSVSDFVRTGLISLLMVGVAMLVFGFRFHGGVAGAIGTLAIVWVFSWSISWLFIALGIATHNPETTQLAGFLFLFPLMFASSAYVPIAGLPGWLQAVAKVNPLSYTIDAARNLALGWPAGADVVRALLALAIVATIGVSAAVLLHRRKA